MTDVSPFATPMAIPGLESVAVKIAVEPDDDAVARKAAAIIAADARAAVPARGRFIMAVSGGRTPWMMLRALASEQLPWESVHVVQVDERAAPATSSRWCTTESSTASWPRMRKG